MKPRNIKLFTVRLVAFNEHTGPCHATIDVAAKLATTACRLAAESAAKRYRTHPTKIDCTNLTLTRTTNWTSERVIKYH